MRETFDAALPITLELEGVYSNHLKDDGGPTHWGITQATYDHYRQSRGLPKRSVREMTPTERDAIYYANYWLAARCYALPERVAIAHFDTAVLPGPGAAPYILQAACGVKCDGKIGTATVKAVAAMDEDRLLEQMQAARRGYFIARAFVDRDNRTFLNGWMNRTYRLLKALGVPVPAGAIN